MAEFVPFSSHFGTWQRKVNEQCFQTSMNPYTGTRALWTTNNRILHFNYMHSLQISFFLCINQQLTSPYNSLHIPIVSLISFIVCIHLPFIKLVFLSSKSNARDELQTHTQRACTQFKVYQTQYWKIYKMVKHAEKFPSLHTNYRTNTFNICNILWYKFRYHNHLCVQNAARRTRVVTVSMTAWERVIISCLHNYTDDSSVL